MPSCRSSNAQPRIGGRALTRRIGSHCDGRALSQGSGDSFPESVVLHGRLTGRAQREFMVRLNVNEAKNHGRKTSSARAIAVPSATYSISPNLISNDQTSGRKISVRDCNHRSITFLTRDFCLMRLTVLQVMSIGATGRHVGEGFDPPCLDNHFW